ncbi:kynurenine formamidase isoform X4 [Malaclemys terrapin pileata]|uniref:kynurenine formamidase isoform X4 n=1 Tax=Malaclemys terrapin pileata TaxID=2991368 RepID=UPI0023A7C9E1|nr:kynurenine formamidase isoform X4 [Malaclemys terrapin pileata]
MGTWRDMTKEELEKQYAPSRWSHRMDKEVVIEAHVRAVTEGTRRAQATMQTLLHVPYGGNDGEKLDIYLPTDPSGAFPLVLYIHGGYWQFLSKEVSGFIAPPLVTQGIAVVAVGYDVAPKGHLDVMVAQVRRSVAFIVQQYSKIRSDCSAVTLSLPREVAWRNSPILGVTAATPARKACEVLIAVAQHDSPEFHRQSQEYFQALRSAGWRVSLLDIADTDHFDVIEKLSQRGYILTQVILNMISRA